MKKILLFLWSLKTQALPLLYEEVAGIPTNAVIVLKDHLDPNLYYIVPNHFSVAENPEKPGEQLVNWFVDGMGKGHLQFAMLPSVYESELKLVKETIASFDQSARYAVVPVKGAVADNISKLNGITLNAPLNNISIGAYTPVDIVVQKSSAKIFIDTTLSSVGYMMGAYLNIFGIDSEGVQTIRRHDVQVNVRVQDPSVYEISKYFRSSYLSENDDLIYSN